MIRAVLGTDPWIGSVLVHVVQYVVVKVDSLVICEHAEIDEVHVS